MILDTEIKNQLSEYLKLMEGEVLIKLSAGSDSVSEDMTKLVQELADMSSLIKIEEAKLARTPSFSVNRLGEDTGVAFAGIPLGHEFTSLVLAILQVRQRPKLDNKVIERVKKIDGIYNFEHILVCCHNCPEVVQALNTMVS